MGDIVLKRLQVGSEGGFTNGAVILPTNSSSVYGTGTAVAASRRLAVDDSSDFGYQELTFEAPEEARGTYAAYYTHVLQMRMAKGKFSSLLYPDDMTYWCRAAVSGNPTFASLPSTPTVLLAATTLAATMTLTTTPAGAGGDQSLAKMLAVTLANVSSVSSPAITVTIQGLDPNGNVVTDTLNFTQAVQTLSKVGGGVGATTVTLYTQNYYASVGTNATTYNNNSFITTGTLASATVAVGGINAWMWTFVPDMASSTLWSLTGEWFDGSTPWQMPGMIVPKLALDIQLGKTAKMTGDCLSKDMTPMAGGLTSLTDNVLPATSAYAARYFSGAFGTPVSGLTTQVSARLLQSAFDFDNQLTLGKAADGTPLPNFVARKRYKTKAELTLLFNNGQLGSEDPADFNAFQSTYKSRSVLVALPASSYLPCGPLNGVTLAASGWPTQLADSQGTPRGGLYGLMVAHAGKFTAASPVNHEGRLAVKLTHEMEADLTGLGAPYTVVLVNRINPNMV